MTDMYEELHLGITPSDREEYKRDKRAARGAIARHIAETLPFGDVMTDHLTGHEPTVTYLSDGTPIRQEFDAAPWQPLPISEKSEQTAA